MNVSVDWQELKTPPEVGTYFVAVKYPSGLGTYDLLLWNGQDWEMKHAGKVVGWVSMNDFMNEIKAGWPKGDRD